MSEKPEASQYAHHIADFMYEAGRKRAGAAFIGGEMVSFADWVQQYLDKYADSRDGRHD